MDAEYVLTRAMTKLIDECGEFGPAENPETTKAWLHSYIEDEFPEILTGNTYFLIGIIVGVTMAEERWAQQLYDELSETEI